MTFVNTEFDSGAPYGSRRPDFQLIQARAKVILEKALTYLGEYDPHATVSNETRLRIQQMADGDQELITATERGLALQAVLDELYGFGPAGPLLRDERVAAIYCVGTGPLFVKCDGGIERTTLSFDSEEHFARVFDRFAHHIDKLNEDFPVGEARCCRDWTVKAAIPPRVKRSVFAMYRMEE